MPDVNEEVCELPQHLAYLLHMASRRMRSEAGRDIAEPLRSLHAGQARLLDLIPSSGTRASELAAVMRVSKQGLGQLVAQLAAGGYVAVQTDPADRRARLVCCTELGHSVQQLMRQRLADVEEAWQHQVGPDRYAVFRQVLAELVADNADPSAGS